MERDHLVFRAAIEFSHALIGGLVGAVIAAQGFAASTATAC
jgi:hypothetical protein